MKHALVLSATIGTYVLFGTSAGATGDPRATQFTYQPWAKICVNRADGNSDCFISSGAKGACQPSGGGIAIAIRDGKQRSLSVNVVTGRKLDVTLDVRIDQSSVIPIPDTNCQERGCRGRLEIDSAFIEGLKHSRTIRIEAMTPDHQGIAFPLAGFAEAYDGPAGQTPKAIETTNEELKARLKRADLNNPPPCSE
jgi:invasion protein IalB